MGANKKLRSKVVRTLVNEIEDVNEEAAKLLRRALAKEHAECLQALKTERKGGGPMGRNGDPMGVTATCKAIKGHLDSIAFLFGVHANPGIVEMIEGLASGDERVAAKLKILNLVLRGKISPAAATAATKVIDSIDGKNGDPYQGQGRRIAAMLMGIPESEVPEPPTIDILPTEALPVPA